MKTAIKLCVLVLSLTIVTSCDHGFDELNTSKTGITNLDPAFVLNAASINSSFPAGTLNYDLGIVQQVISPNTGLILGANFNQLNINNTPVIWTNYYQNVVRYTKDVIVRTTDDATRSNLRNMARIIQAHAFIILTDTYGDIPYFDAGTGYTDQNFFPEYDTQQSVYADIIKELKEATAGLDPAGRVETADVLYAGNVDKWKKLGNSLLLRAGMRLKEVDPATAEATVAAAFAGGGLITTNADNAYIRHDANFVNNMGNQLNGTEAANFFLAEPFVDALKTNNDPRLSSIAIRFVGAASGPAQVAAVATKAPADQFGLPVGSTDNDADVSGASLPGGGKRYAYSQVDRTRLVSRTAPVFFVTAGQTNLLLAEAAYEGWISGNAVDYFSAGIAAHMDQMATYNAASTVAPADRDNYIASRVAAFAGNEVEYINYEYWIASFLNGPEAWANFRRSGYPVLEPNPFPGRSVEFIQRMTYPPSEILVNSENVQAAISSIGSDALDTKVWWDK
jgi:hypothetical protein